jgi:diguanylate cyclase (GGDEF)-like protein
MAGKTMLIVVVALAMAIIVGLYVRLWRKYMQHSRAAERIPELGQEPAPSQPQDCYLEALKTVSAQVVSAEDAETKLSMILAEVQRSMAFDHVDARVVDETTQELVVHAEAGRGSVVGKRLPVSVGLISRIAQSGEPALVQDTDLDQYPVAISDARSALCVPLTYQAALLGVLAVESASENAFPPEAVQTLRITGNLLAATLHETASLRNLQQHAVTDELTGLKTRGYFLEALQTECKRAARNGQSFAIVILGLDRLREVHEVLGRLESEVVLARAGRLLAQRSRQSNVVARYGEDEFSLLIPDAGLEQTQTLAERLRFWLEADPLLKERRVTGSFGVAIHPLHGSNPQILLSRAESTMHLSRQGGGNRVTIKPAR